MKNFKYLVAALLMTSQVADAQVVFGENEKEYIKTSAFSTGRVEKKDAKPFLSGQENYKLSTLGSNWFASIKAGMSTAEIDKLVHDFTVAQGAIPAPLNYQGFPKSCCTSINDEICHGIPSEDVILKEGDIINVDVSTIFNGYFSDASRMFKIGAVHPELDKLVDVAKECLDCGLKAAKPWGFMGDIAEAVQKHAEANGYSVVREFGGHGIGLQFHEDPFVAHVGKAGTGMLLVPGMTFTIEPMINMGAPDLFIDADNDWTALTEDGYPSAQWEYTVLITEDGAEILTY